MQWICKKFDDLIPLELYRILQLRNEVFVVEQQCIYQDLDNKDLLSWHLMGRDSEKLLAYTRLIPPGIAYQEPSIGRVVTSPQVRGTGAGKELMQKSISEIYNLFGRQSIRIGAQYYLLKFYRSLGFLDTGDLYLEDGIRHIEMVKP